MKKMKIYALLFLLSILCFTSCSKETPKSNTTKIKATASPTKNYKDDTISCSYDASVLKYKESSPNDNLRYGIVFSDNLSTMSDDVINGSCLYVATQSHSITYENWMLTDMTKSLFNGTFGIKEDDSTKITKLDNGVYEYTARINDIEYYGRLLNINDSELTMCICRILPEENEKYKDALKTCYESIEYLKENPLTEETVNNSQGITSGDLYDSIKAINNNFDLIKIDNSYSVTLISDSPKNFFTSCEKIYKRAFKENESVVFSWDTKKEKNIATLTVIRNDDNEEWPIHATLTIFNKNNKKKITSAYSKNKYLQSIDLKNLSNQSFQKIVDKYSKQ